jgi:hypothetical protein
LHCGQGSDLGDGQGDVVADVLSANHGCETVANVP